MKLESIPIIGHFVRKHRAEKLRCKTAREELDAKNEKQIKELEASRDAILKQIEELYKKYKKGLTFKYIDKEMILRNFECKRDRGGWNDLGHFYVLINLSYINANECIESKNMLDLELFENLVANEQEKK